MTKLLKQKEVCHLTGLSRTHILRLERNEKHPDPDPFPERVPLSTSRVAWVEEEVLGWIERRLSRRKRRPRSSSQE